jgi:ribulose-phosphate 3-epimerase
MMDGRYVKNIAFAPQHLKSLRPYTKLPFHVHLELSEPDQILDAMEFLYSDLIIVQLDTLLHPTKTFAHIRSLNARVGICLNPGDPIQMAQDHLANIDCLLLLGVHPGFGGQTIQSGIEEKIAQARQIIDSTGQVISLAVDGGIHPGNAQSLIRAGADRLIIGTALFQSIRMEDIVSKIKAMPALHLHRCEPGEDGSVPRNQFPDSVQQGDSHP